MDVWDKNWNILKYIHHGVKSFKFIQKKTGEKLIFHHQSNEFEFTQTADGCLLIRSYIEYDRIGRNI